MMGRRLVIGLGNEWRSDDGVGPAVAEALRTNPALMGDSATEIVSIEDPSGLLDTWEGAEEVVVVDACRTGKPPGTIQILETAPSPTGAVSSHGVGLAEAIALGQALDRLPRRLVIVGIEALTFAEGVGLSVPVLAAVAPAVRVVCCLLVPGSCSQSE